MAKLSIIIVSYNTSNLTYKCIESIYLNVTSTFEIIVIDNNSKDDTIVNIKYNFPHVKLIENKENLFFAKANNQGIKLATGKYILLLNSDTIIFDKSVDVMIDWMENNQTKQLACVGPRVINSDKTLQSEGSYLPSLKASLFFTTKLHKLPVLSKIVKNFVPKGMTKYQNGKIREVGWVSGCCMLFFSDILKKIDGLNEELEFYGEEVEIGYRLAKGSYKTFVLPTCGIIHLGGMSNYKSNSKKDIENYLILQKLTIGYFHAFCKGLIITFYRFCILCISILYPKLSVKRNFNIFLNEFKIEYHLFLKLLTF